MIFNRILYHITNYMKRLINPTVSIKYSILIIKSINQTERVINKMYINF